MFPSHLFCYSSALLPICIQKLYLLNYFSPENYLNEDLPSWNYNAALLINFGSCCCAEVYPSVLHQDIVKVIWISPNVGVTAPLTASLCLPLVIALFDPLLHCSHCMLVQLHSTALQLHWPKIWVNEGWVKWKVAVKEQIKVKCMQKETFKGKIKKERKKSSFTCIQHIWIPACLAVSHPEQMQARWFL